MAVWEKAVLTTKGSDLLKKLAAGNTLSLVRAAASTGYVSSGNLAAQTALTGESIDLSFGKIAYTGTGQCTVPVKLSNSGITTAKTVCQVGIYAQDPDEGEILYMIAQATITSSGEIKGTYLPSVSEVVSFAVTWNFILTYGQADGVTVVVDPAGTVTRDELENSIYNLTLSVTQELNQFKTEVAEDLSEKAPLHAVAYGITTEGNGAEYYADVEGISALTAGATFMMIPHVQSTTTAPTLDVNGLGAKMIRRRVSNSTSTTVAAATENWLGANKPVRVTYDGNWWIADIIRPNATDIYGTVAIENGGTGAASAAAALENLGALPKAGGKMTGAIDMGGNGVTNLSAPANGSDAATRDYADSVGAKRLQLYTNTDYDTAYDAQTVNASGLSSCHEVHYEFATDCGDTYGVFRTAGSFVYVNGAQFVVTAILSYNNSVTQFYRTLKVSGETIEFGDCYMVSGTTVTKANLAMIPSKFIGIKYGTD